MASRGIQMTLVVLALFSILSSGATAQSTSACTNAIASLSPCINYVTGNISTPSSSCCMQLASVVQGSPQCLCQVLNASGASLGFTVNQTLALSLPGACNVQTPSISQCQAASPATSPISAPPAASPAAASPAAATAGSPTETSNETPEPTTSTTTPSASSTPSATGSKTVPSTTASSGGDGIKAPVQFLVFVAAFASAVSMF